MFQTGSGRLYTVKRLWSIDPYGNSHKDHLQDGHDEKQRSHEPSATGVMMGMVMAAWLVEPVIKKLIIF